METIIQLNESINKVLKRGIPINYAAWHKLTKHNIYVKYGSTFIMPGFKSWDYGVAGCNPLGAVMFLDHVDKMANVSKDLQVPLTNTSYNLAAQLLKTNVDWIIAFGHGWDAVGLDNKTTEINPEFRKMFNSEAYDWGIKLRESI